MSNALYEHHKIPNSLLPFIFHTDGANITQHCNNWHKNPEFLYCIKGSGRVLYDNTPIPFSKGDTVIINANALHVVQTDETIFYRCLIIDRSFFAENGLSADAYVFDRVVQSRNLGDLMEKISSLYYSNRTPLNIASLRAAVLTYLTEVCLNHSSPAEAKRAPEASKCSSAIRAVIEYIDENFDKKLTLDYLAEMAGFSKYHFARVFKESTGFTITEQINARRCEEAKKLLLEAGESISEIGQQCGFDNASYFTRTFKRYTGLLPSEYAQNNTYKQ